MDPSENRLADYTDDSSIGRGSIDVPFLLLVLLLLTIGVIMVLSSSFVRAYYSAASNHTATYYFTRQLGFAALGVGVMIFVSRFPIGFFRKLSFYIFLGSVFFLFLVVVQGTIVNGSRRWFELFGIRFQPSEIAKIAVILYDSHLACKYRDQMNTFRKGVLPFAIVAGIIILFLALEPHLSASIIILLVSAVIMFVGGTKLYWFIIGGCGASLLFLLAISVFDYSSERISVWLNPLADTSNTGYQISQSLYAIGSGGLNGLGLGNGRQKFLYLPEEHNDFIFSVVCEELGFIGACVILILFALLVIRGYWLAMHCKDRYSFLVCTGITSLLAIQVLFNVGVVTSLIPCTGISLPFFSYGGTALLIQLAEMGIILSISRDIPEIKPVKRKVKSIKSSRKVASKAN